MQLAVTIPPLVLVLIAFLFMKATPPSSFLGIMLCKSKKEEGAKEGQRGRGND